MNFQYATDFLKELLGYYKGWVVVSGDSSHLDSIAAFLKAARELNTFKSARILLFDEVRAVSQCARVLTLTSAHPRGRAQL